MRRTGRIALLLLLFLLGLARATALAATDAPPRLWAGPTIFAVQAHVRRLNVPYLRRAVDAGFDAVRIPLVPWWAQGADGAWMWTNYDAMYAWLRKRGVTPLFVLQNPRGRDDIAPMIDFARKAGARYPGALLELGNEPDNSEQWPTFYPPRSRGPLSADAYWKIEKSFAAAWREGSPRAHIATAGTSGVDLDWQRALVRAIEQDGGFKDGTIDAVGVHTYGERLPSRSTRRGDVVADLTTLRGLLPASVEVWVTEYGLIDPLPQDVTGWFTTMEALGVAVFSWYELQDDVMDGETQRYGLFTLDAKPKPALDAAREYLRARAERPHAIATPTPAASVR